MADPFELWRVAWLTAIERGMEQISEAMPGTAALDPRGQADRFDLSGFPVFDRIRIELATMLMLEHRARPRAHLAPLLIVAPYAVHEASIADFAERHSLAQVLAESGCGGLALTYWKSATAEMRNYGVDAYLSDLNVAVDELGGRARLVGLCQGGWLAAAYAARFPAKVAKLVLAGAPIDLSAAESRITQTLMSVSPAMIAQGMALAGGRVSGPMSLVLGSDDLSREFNAEAALQCVDDPAMARKFDAWNARTVDLPGAYFLQVCEWLFRENRLAQGRFPALGRQVGLGDIEAPIFVLAAAEDEVVSPPQALAVKALCPKTPVETRVAPGRHLSLFMGSRTLRSAWKDIARWLNACDAAPPRAHRAGLSATTGAP